MLKSNKKIKNGRDRAHREHSGQECEGNGYPCEEARAEVIWNSVSLKTQLKLKGCNISRDILRKCRQYLTQKFEWGFLVTNRELKSLGMAKAEETASQFLKDCEVVGSTSNKYKVKNGDSVLFDGNLVFTKDYKNSLLPLKARQNIIDKRRERKSQWIQECKAVDKQLTLERRREYHRRAHSLDSLYFTDRKVKKERIRPSHKVLKPTRIYNEEKYNELLDYREQKKREREIARMKSRGHYAPICIEPQALYERTRSISFNSESDFTSILMDGLNSELLTSRHDMKKFLVNTTVFLYQLYRVRDTFDFLSITYMYASTMDIVELDKVKKGVTKLITSFKKSPDEKDVSLYFEEETKGESNYYNVESPFEIETQSHWDKATLAVHALSRVMKSGFAKVVRDIVLTIASYKWLSKDVAQTLYTFLGSPPKMSVTSFFEYCVDSVLTLLQYGKALCSGVSFQTLFAIKEPVSDTINQIQSLLSMSERLYTGLQVEGMMDKTEFVQKGQELVSLAKMLLDSMAPMTRSSSSLQTLVFHLENQVVEKRLQLLGNTRPMPFGVILHGDPGIGKGGLLTYLAAIWSHVRGRDFKDTHVYHRTKTSDYWEGYHPLSQPYVHYSELGNMTREMVKRKGDPMIDELNSVIDTLPMTADMAFGEKGKLFIRPELVLVDTNNSDLNLPVLVTNEAAYARRFLYIEPIVKQEFRRDGSTALDSTKSLASNCKLMDKWVFRVHSCIPKDKRNYHTYVHMQGHEGDDIYALTDLVCGLYAKHITTQEILSTRMVSEVVVTDYLNNFKRGPWIHPNEEGEGYVKHHFVDDEKEWEELENQLVIAGIDVSDFPVREEISSQSSFAGYAATTAAYMLWTPIQHWYSSFMSTLFSLFSLMITAVVFKYSVIRKARWTSYISLAVLILFTLAVGSLPVPMFIFALETVFSTAIRTSIETQSAHDALSVMIMNKVRRKWNKFKGLFSVSKIYYPFASHWWNEHKYAIVATATTTAFLLKVVNYLSKSRSIGDTQAETISSTPVLEDYEKRFECGSSYKRVPIRGHHQIWNTRIGDVAGPHKGDFHELNKKVSRNVRKALIVKGDSTVSTYVLGVQGDIALVNTHALGDDSPFEIFISNKGTLDTDVVNCSKVTMVTNQNRVDIGNDLSILRLQSVQFSNIMPHIADGSYNGSSYAALFNHVNVSALYVEVEITMNSKGGRIVVPRIFKYSFPDHHVGACGLPLLLKKGNSVVVAGFHAGAKKGEPYGYAVVFDKILIEKSIDRLHRKEELIPLHSMGDIQLQSLHEPIPQSAFHYEDLRQIQYFGKVPGAVLANGHSRLVPTNFSHEIKPLFSKYVDISKTKNYGPPVMQAIKGNEFKSPWNNALRAMAKPKKCLDRSVLNRIVVEFSDRIVNMLKQRGVTQLKPLTAEVAINGIPIDAFTRRMNASSSAGFGRKGPKGKYLPLIEGTETRMMTPELKADVEKVIQSYLDGNTACAINTACLKDEARSAKKIESGDTRLFYVAELSSMIVAKMFLKPYYSLMVEHNDIFQCCIGINIYSDADRLFNELCRTATHVGDGDYKQYDMNIPFEIKHAAASVADRTLRKLGYSEDALKIVRGVLTESLYPFILLLGDIIMVAGQQLSGRDATAEDNCGIGVILVMYAWYMCKETRDHSFFDYVTLYLYGDDNIIQVHERFKDIFNLQTYSAMCKHFYNMDFTDANKTGHMPKFMDPYTCSFLKRTFKYRSDLDRHIAILDIDSLLKSLMWTIPSESISRDDQMEATINSALRELALHLEREAFDGIRNDLIELYKKYYDKQEFYRFFTYDALITSMFGTPIVSPDVSDESETPMGMEFADIEAQC